MCFLTFHFYRGRHCNAMVFFEARPYIVGSIDSHHCTISWESRKGVLGVPKLSLHLSGGSILGAGQSIYKYRGPIQIYATHKM